MHIEKWMLSVSRVATHFAVVAISNGDADEMDTKAATYRPFGQEKYGNHANRDKDVTFDTLHSGALINARRRTHSARSFSVLAFFLLDSFHSISVDRSLAHIDARTRKTPSAVDGSSWHVWIGSAALPSSGHRGPRHCVYCRLCCNRCFCPCTGDNIDLNRKSRSPYRTTQHFHLLHECLFSQHSQFLLLCTHWCVCVRGRASTQRVLCFFFFSFDPIRQSLALFSALRRSNKMIFSFHQIYETSNVYDGFRLPCVGHVVKHTWLFYHLRERVNGLRQPIQMNGKKRNTAENIISDVIFFLFVLRLVRRRTKRTRATLKPTK